MSAEYPMFIFVGDTARRAELAEAAANRNWFVYDTPEDLLYGTLAQVVAFFPDALVIEDDSTAAEPSLAHDIVMHLESIHYEPIILLTDAPASWQLAAESRVAVLPRNTPTNEILDAVRALVNEAEPIWA